MAPSNILTCVFFRNLQILKKMGLLLSLGVKIMGDFNFISSFSKLSKITVLLL